MEGTICFSLLEKSYAASYLISQEEYPTYIYVFFSDPWLIHEFGAEICIHSEGTTLLIDDINSAKRIELYSIIFDEIKKKVELNDNPLIVANNNYQSTNSNTL